MSDAHTHAPVLRDLGPAFKWAVVLNVGYVLIEAAAGLAIGSLALLADAAHNLTDVAGLLIAWGAVIAARKPPSGRFSYGFGRSTILAALANSIAILVGVGAVVWESVQRFSDPVIVPPVPVLIVAVIGITISMQKGRFSIWRPTPRCPQAWSSRQSRCWRPAGRGSIHSPPLWSAS